MYATVDKITNYIFQLDLKIKQDFPTFSRTYGSFCCVHVLLQKHGKPPVNVYINRSSKGTQKRLKASPRETKKAVTQRTQKNKFGASKMLPRADDAPVKINDCPKTHLGFP